ncbi:MAG: VOC family protein [Pseudonocardia sp.]
MTPAPGTPIGVALLGADRGRAGRFYGDLFGWTFPTSPTTGTTVAVGADGVPVATVLPAAEGGLVNGWLVTLRAPVDARERIIAAGGRVLDVAGSPMYAADPAGATFAVAPSTAGVPLPRPGLGRAAWFENMTTDAAGSDRFYSEVFGLVPDLTGTAEGYALLIADGSPVAGRLALPPGLARVLGVRWMVYVANADVDRAAEQVAPLGGRVVVPPRDTPTGRVSAVSDPDGAVFTLLTRR